MPAFKFCPQCTKPLGEIDHGGLRRPACLDAECGFVLWDNPVPVVAAIVEHDGDIILARNALWPEHMFALITGFLERDDPDPASGVLREVEEELGLTGRIESFVGHYAAPQANQLIIAYHVVATGTIQLNEELVEYKRVKPDQLQPWSAATGLALRDWMLRRGLTPRTDEEILATVTAYRKIDNWLSTSGQPAPEQLVAVRGVFKAVINLAAANAPGAFAAEPALVRRWGMRYHAIPVDRDDPTEDDFRLFCAAMDAERDAPTLVHGTADLVAPVFVYLYRILRLGVDPGLAAQALASAWKPTPRWEAFMERMLKIQARPE